MKHIKATYLVWLLMVSAGYGQDKPTSNVLISETRSSPLAAAFLKQKECNGLRALFSGDKQEFYWSLSWADDDLGITEVSLQKLDHQQAFLGVNLNKAVKKACQIINEHRKTQER